MEGSKQTTLRSAENLSLPSVQMVVMNASADCNHCRERVSKVVSKMNFICSRTAGLHVRLAQQRGDSDGGGCGHQKLQASQRITAYQDKKISSCSLALFRLICSAVFEVFHNA
ncbi:unnamed protein product [Musa acuminata subsp. malaccensis]|uniref:(wild Malaysian banana) hypothetical protein n=1 Tax=Musa acuminata subsp. malaccensis TaxID=214687 RepID=A0A804J7V8_MUSAM|nr:PREDICTED: uncharacterized protein LOC103985593 isoform X1 [Musa acuminata subsp. malaccensis]CAG1839408.1 unnamed protein product [Musa acuminata subsp. malaccensis]